MPQGQVLEFSGVTKQFGAVAAVSQFTTRVEPGFVTGFLGPNGAGKSTTLRMLLALVRPTAGYATIGGKGYRDLRDPARTIGAVLEATSFHPGRSAENHLRVYAKAGKIPLSRVPAVLELVGLAAASERKVGGFSLGMRQRLALATALLGDPGVLVLDEPTNGLDPEGISWMRGFLRALAAEGRTIFVSSHMLSEVEQTVDRLVVISKGKLVFQGDTNELAGSDDAITVVDSPDRAALSDALTERGLPFELLRSGLTVRGASPTEVGAIAAANGVALSSLARKGESLEEIFFQLVDGTRVHPSAQGSTTVLAPLAASEPEDAPTTILDAVDDDGSAATVHEDDGATAIESVDLGVGEADAAGLAATLVPGAALPASGVVVAAAARTPEDAAAAAAAEASATASAAVEGSVESPDAEAEVEAATAETDVSDEALAEDAAPFVAETPADRDVEEEGAPIEQGDATDARAAVSVDPTDPTLDVDAELPAITHPDAKAIAEDAPETGPISTDINKFAKLFDPTQEQPIVPPNLALATPVSDEAEAFETPALNDASPAFETPSLNAQSDGTLERPESIANDAAEASVDANVVQHDATTSEDAPVAPWWKPAAAASADGAPVDAPTQATATARPWWQPAEVRFPLSTDEASTNDAPIVDGPTDGGAESDNAAEYAGAEAEAQSDDATTNHEPTFDELLWGALQEGDAESPEVTAAEGAEENPFPAWQPAPAETEASAERAAEHAEPDSPEAHDAAHPNVPTGEPDANDDDDLATRVFDVSSVTSERDAWERRNDRTASDEDADAFFQRFTSESENPFAARDDEHNPFDPQPDASNEGDAK